MNVNDIVHNLQLVGEELEALQIPEPIEVLLIGGSFMLTQIKNRTVTNDVDVAVIRPDATSESYRMFKGAVKFVAHDEGLDPSWLSTNMEDFLRIAGPLPRRLRLWKRFGPLSVYIPPKKFILAHKLVAGRVKDRDDIEALFQQLRIHTRAQAQQILDTYIRSDIQAINHVEDTLNNFFE